MLDVLVFTDASAAEALNGSPGFQFIAHSDGATRTDESVAADRLQHVVTSRLPQDEWDRHPATCAYVRVDGRMYLSRGHSSGATLGGRPGNQLTVTVMTSDEYDILPLRPAQLYSSPAWNFARPSSPDQAGWESPIDIGEDFDIPGLHALVVDDPWAVEALPSALTMLEQTQTARRTRLFIRHPDQAVVMRWVALLSRFLDADSALGLEFRVFADDPLRSNAHVVGVHPLLNPDLTVISSDGSGVNVIDLERRELSAVEVSESAARYARWFISGDPYEALEAIDVGHRWSRHMPRDVAAAAAELATMDSTRGQVDVRAFRTSLTAISALATARETDELEAYGDVLADLAASFPPTGSADLLAVDGAMWAASSAGDDELAQSLALAALEWTAVQPNLVSPWAAATDAAGHSLRWHSEDARLHAAGLLASSLGSAAIEHPSQAFLLAGALNTAVSAEAIEGPIRSLVGEWMTDPGLGARLGLWAQSEAVRRHLISSLDAKISEADPAVVQSVIEGEWDWLAPGPWVIDPQNPMSRWFALRELRGASSPRRAEILALVQQSVPSHAWRLFLAGPTGLDPREVAGWIRSHRSLDPELAIEVERILHQIDTFPSWRRAGGATVLHEIGKLGSAIPIPLVASVDSQAQIIALFSRASAERSDAVNRSLRVLEAQFGGRLTGLYGDWIVKAVLESEDTRAATALAEGPGRAGVLLLTQSMLEEQLRSVMPMAMVAAVRLLDPAQGPWNAVAKDALNSIWDDRKADPIREQLLASVHGRLGAEEQRWLDQYLEAQSKGRLGRGMLRGAKSVFGNRDN